MKFGVFGLDNFSSGKENIIDKRLDKIKELANSSKKAYIQAEVIVEDTRLIESDAILTIKEKKADLILTDLEFVEKRLANTQEDKAKNLLNRFKEQLEKEKFLYELELSEDDKNLALGYSLLSTKPVFLAGAEELEDRLKVLASAFMHCGYICFFTANEKEARAWGIKQGSNAWGASGLIHSDIQKGFIRAEVIGYDDLVNDGGINQARANNHLRVEAKEYIIQDADFIKFRFNK